MTVAVACRALALSTSRFGHLGGMAFALMKPISRPPLPTLGHSRDSKQPLDFIAITGLDANYVSDGQTKSRPLDYPDLITRAYSTLDDSSSIRAWSQCLRTLERKPTAT